MSSILLALLFVLPIVTSKPRLFDSSKSLRFEADTFLHSQDVHASFLEVKETATLTLVNSDIALVKNTLNKGTLRSLTNNLAVPSRGFFLYEFSEHFVNEGTFIVRQDNTGYPIHVKFAAKRRTKYLIFTREPTYNKGIMIFLSNGPDSTTAEFLFELEDTFLNINLVAILGTERHRARLEVRMAPGAKWLYEKHATKPEVLNKSYFYVKNAALHQKARFNVDGGCVILAENSYFFSNPTEVACTTYFLFRPNGKAACLFIQGEGLAGRGVVRFKIMSFPKGSSIKLSGNYDKSRFFSGEVHIWSTTNFQEFKFEFIGLDTHYEKFNFEDNTLTYEDDAPYTGKGAGNCRSFLNVEKDALEHEIRI